MVNKRKRKNGFPFKCFKCNKKGHKAAFCPKNKQVEYEETAKVADSKTAVALSCYVETLKVDIEFRVFATCNVKQKLLHIICAFESSNGLIVS